MAATPEPAPGPARVDSARGQFALWQIALIHLVERVERFVFLAAHSALGKAPFLARFGEIPANALFVAGAAEQ